MEIGILDPKGKNKNPLTNEEYSDNYKKLAEKWSSLPGYKKRAEVIDEIKKNQIILIVAETGSGKTVLVPKYALHALDYNAKIAVTLPKKIVTKSAAEYAAATLDVELGSHVGYKYRGSEDDSSSKETKLLYATDGTIVAKLLNDPKLEDIDVVIVDEAHERKIQIDFLLYLLKNAMKLRPDFKVIIMSATINSEIFKNYFSNLKFKQINMSGRTNYPIESVFLKENFPYNEVLDEGFKILQKIIKEDDVNKKGAHDILFFVTSSNEAHSLCNKLYSINYEDVMCIEVYSGMNNKKKKLAQDKDLYKKDGKYVRKLVIATNVAESSLTIDGIKYVIDSGYEFKSMYDPIKRAKILDRKLITQAQAKQRMGRAGRTEPGICYHLYTKSDFEDDMEKFPKPDIKVGDLSGPSLKLLNLDKIDGVEKLINIYTEFIEPPSEEYIRSAIMELMRLGAIESDKITKLGRMMSEIGMDPMPALSLILSKIYECSNEMIVILCAINTIKNNIGSIFNDPRRNLKNNKKDREKFNYLTNKINEAKNKLKHKYGDHLTLLNIMEKYEKVRFDNKKLNDWAYDHFLKVDVLREISKLVNKIKSNVYRKLPRKLEAKDLNLEFNDDIMNQTAEDRVLSCLIIGYQMNTGSLMGNHYRIQSSMNMKVKMDRNSFLNLNKKKPNDIFYSELFISMGRAELNICSKIPKKFANFTK